MGNAVTKSSHCDSLLCSNDYLFDIFFCCSDEDRTFVIELLQILEGQYGLRCCIDYRDFRPGIVENFYNGVTKSFRTVVVLSSSLFKNPLCEFQFKLAYYESVYRSENPVIFLAIDGCKFPKNRWYLNLQTCIDATGSTSDWIPKLLQAIHSSNDTICSPNNKWTNTYKKTKCDVTPAKVMSYANTMHFGKDKARNIRIMLLGKTGVGKTTFGKNLINEPANDVQNTNGIDIFTAYMSIDLFSKQKTKLATGQGQTLILQKIKHAIDAHGTETQEHAVCNSYSEIVHQLLMRYFEEEEQKPNSNDNYIKDAKLDVLPSLDIATYIDKLVDVYERTPTESTENAYLSLWDFAGESVFYATHQIFLNDDALYMVFFNLSRCLMNDKEIENVLQWLESIATYSNTIPPVILVGTHLDKLYGTKVEKLSAAIEITDRLLEKISHRRWPFLTAHFIANLNPDPKVMSTIWDDITEAAPYQSQWEIEIPSRWLSLEQKLMEMRASGKNWMTLYDVIAVNKLLECPISYMSDILSLLEYLHNSGFILFVRDKLHPASFDQIVIINPQWVVKAFRCIITDPKFHNRGDEIEWKKFEKTAKLPQDLMIYALGEEFSADIETVITVMSSLGLLTEPLLDASETKKYFIVPSFLTHPDLNWLIDKLRNIKLLKLSSAFVFHFKGFNVPDEVFDKLLAKAVSKYQPYDIHSENCIRRGFCLLRIAKRNLGFILHCKRSTIKVTLLTVDRLLEGGEGFDIRHEIQEWLEEIMNTVGLKKIWESLSECLHCRCYVDQMDTYVPIQHLDLEPQPCCPLSSNSHTLSKAELAPWIVKEKEDENQIPCSSSRIPDVHLKDVEEEQSAALAVLEASQLVGKGISHQNICMNISPTLNVTHVTQVQNRDERNIYTGPTQIGTTNVMRPDDTGEDKSAESSDDDELDEENS